MQGFLNAVTTSFRRNLDNEHGIGKPDEDGSSASHSRSVARADLTATRSPRPRPIEKHMASLVNNPLFLSISRNPEPKTPTPSPRDPMDVFDEAVAKGMMTLKIATGCLEAKRRLIAKEAGLYKFQAGLPRDPAQGLKEKVPRRMDLVLGNMSTWAGHDVAGRVLAWLFASGMETTMEYLTDKSFVTRLMVFLVAEGKDDVVWSWIDTLMLRGGVPDHHLARDLLYTLSVTKVLEGDSADGGLETIITASNSYLRHPRHKALLSAPWIDIACITNNIIWRGPVASDALFDRYLAVSDLLAPHAVELQVAHLYLHHPSSPTHHRATEYFAALGKTYTQSSARPVMSKKQMATIVNRELDMGVNAMNLMRVMGDIAAALELERFVKTFYGKDVSDHQNRFLAATSI